MTPPALFDPTRHEPLLAQPWDASRVRAAIADIVADCEDAMDGDATWPWHPQDLDGESPPARHKSIYLGASGVLWSLWYLQRAGAVSLRCDPAALIARTWDAYVAHPDTEEVVPSYFLGEAGILLVQWRLTHSEEAAQRLYGAIERNIPNATNEALWAAPGTMVGALHMLRWTGDARWRDLYLANVEHVWRTWLPNDAPPCHLWTQDLYGRIVRLLGAGHGFAGNAYALLRGAALLAPERRAALFARCVETLRVTAILDDDCANWPSGLEPPRAGRPNALVQWCHGAPGIVTGLTDFPVGESPEMDRLLIAAGNLVWKAGPLTKGPGVCHGTAGNGYAFLKLHARTGEAHWLDRARAFAMHALVQCEHARRQHGQGRYSLWTGDAGVAIYLWHCLQGAGGLPALDLLD